MLQTRSLSSKSPIEELQPALERPVILRARVWIPLLAFVAFAIHYLLPRLATVEGSLDLVRSLRVLPLLLALVAEALSYVANGWLLWTTITFSKERVSLRRCVAIVTAASTVSLVAAGVIGYAASVYEWTRRSGVRRETATLAAAVPSAFDGAALVLVGAISAAILMLRGRMETWALRSVSIVMLMLVVATTVTLLALFAPKRARDVVARILGPKRRKIAEQIEETLEVVRSTIRGGGALRAFTASSRNLICPPAYSAGGTVRSLRIEYAVTDLPQPLSPTSPSVSPLAISRLTPSTALTTPSSVRKLTRRSEIRSSWGSRIEDPGLRAGDSCCEF